MLSDVVIAVLLTVVRGAPTGMRATEDVVVAEDVSMFASDDASAVVVMAEKSGAEGGVGNDTLSPSVIITVTESVLTSEIVPKLCTSVVTGGISCTLTRVRKSLSLSQELGLTADAEVLGEVVAECSTLSYSGRVSSGPLAMDPDDK